MASKNGKTAEAVVSEVSISCAHNNTDIRSGFESGNVSIYLTFEQLEYKVNSIKFNAQKNKYACEVSRLTDSFTGTLNLKGDRLIKYVVNTPKVKPEVKPEVKVEVKPEVKPEVKVEPKQDQPIAITFPTLRSIADKLTAIDKAVNDERARELLDRLNTLQADLLDYFAGTPESKPEVKAEEPKAETKPEVATPTPKTEKASNNKPENSTKTPQKRDTETKESKQQKWSNLKAINSLVKTKEMSAKDAAIKYNMSPNSISAHLAAYRLCLKHDEVKKAWIAGQISWNTIRDAAQVQKMLGETLTLEAAMGRISIKDAKAQAKA